MKFIGNIVTDSKLDDVELFNVVKDIKDIVNDIPTLVIGWEKVNGYFDNVKVLDWEVKPNIYWTFGKRERRNQMERDIARFRNMAMSKFSKNTKYTFLNILTASKDVKTRLFDSLKDDKPKTIYVYNDIMYCCYSETGNVIGLSLRDISYGGGDIKRIFSTLYKNDNVKIVKDKEDVPFAIRHSFKYKLYAIPYMYS